MGELLAKYPWARRALFRNFHIGGCASCGFSDEETLAAICARNGNISPEAVLESVHLAHETDEALMAGPEGLDMASFAIIDIRPQEEFEAVSIPGSTRLTSELIQTMMGSWPKDRAILVVDHTGDRSLDAAAYFAGHGFSNVRCLRGGIDRYSLEVDNSLPRYSVE